MATKTKKAMFRTETAKEKAANEPQIRCYVKRPASAVKQWRVDVRDSVPVGSGVDLVAVDHFTGEMICFLASVRREGLRRSAGASGVMLAEGYDLQGMEFDDAGRLMDLERRGG